ncbi:basic proline-rich protein-like [Sciurus carolinensis]|uniref:basic proline-rich protein-like n=1 Tax=Sciurus carolinensis TaxID=30640 RepID=UPI001FB552D9|nr:basic proline-rich protein-like [Sciurus carolinensis]
MCLGSSRGGTCMLISRLTAAPPANSSDHRYQPKTRSTLRESPESGQGLRPAPARPPPARPGVAGAATAAPSPPRPPRGEGRGAPLGPRARWLRGHGAVHRRRGATGTRKGTPRRGRQAGGGRAGGATAAADPADGEGRGGGGVAGGGAGGGRAPPPRLRREPPARRSPSPGLAPAPSRAHAARAAPAPPAGWTAARCAPGPAPPPVTARPPPRRHPSLRGLARRASLGRPPPSLAPRPWPRPRPARPPRPPRRPPSPAAAGRGESEQRGPGGGSPARSRPQPSERAGRRAAARAPPPPSRGPRPWHGALRMRRGAGAGLRARSGVVSAAPRAPTRPPPARAPRRGHAVAHLAGDQGDPGGPLHLRHPPHPLRDPLVHLPRCGLRPRHLSPAARGAPLGAWRLRGPAGSSARRPRPPAAAPPRARLRHPGLTFRDRLGRVGRLKPPRALVAAEASTKPHGRSKPASGESGPPRTTRPPDAAPAPEASVPGPGHRRAPLRGPPTSMPLQPHWGTRGGVTASEE